jgi:hypothetical protein
MRRLAPWLLGLAVLLQSLAAPALALPRAHGLPWSIPVCGPDGPASMDLPAEAPASHGGGFCALCAALPGAPPLRVPLPPVAAWTPNAAWAPADAAPPAPHARPSQPRAPPVA